MLIALRRLLGLFAVLGALLTLVACQDFGANGKATAPLSGALMTKISAIGSTPGAPMMMRIFKQDSVLEVWKQTSAGPYALLATYNICSWSGGLGPKVVEGDRQAPEGFYDITPGLLNAKSSYYLAFNTGFPNKFDRAYGRTGGDLMVHGDCSSSGCYAMTDTEIAEIFSLVRESLAGGNRSVPLEIFPFRMTAGNLAAHAGNTNMAFWQNIKSGYDAFEASKTPPRWDVCDKKYVFNSASASGQPLDAGAPCPALRTATLGAPVSTAATTIAVASIPPSSRPAMAGMPSANSRLGG